MKSGRRDRERVQREEPGEESKAREQAGIACVRYLTSRPPMSSIVTSEIQPQGSVTGLGESGVGMRSGRDEGRRGEGTKSTSILELKPVPYTRPF